MQQHFNSGPKPQTLSIAGKHAEALFETKNVAEIREIEKRTQQHIEEKNVQLRLLVGNSYRDLIDSADKIVSIASQCEDILRNVTSIQEAFVGLATSASGANSTPGGKPEAARKHAELYAIGARVKYQLDTPEVIWGCLDSKQHLEAARRLLRARQVHDLLHGGQFPQEALSKFPLLHHQWPLVLKFEQQILDISEETLASPAPLAPAEAADALASLAALRQLDAAAALAAWLDARGAAVVQGLAAAGAEAAGGASPQAMCGLADAVMNGIALAGQLFLERAGAAGGAGAALQEAVTEQESDASELFFGGGYGVAEGPACPEAVGWQRRSAALAARLAPLPRAAVEAACTAWLRRLSGAFSERGVGLLRGCDDAAALHAAELALTEHLAAWRHDPLGGGGGGAASAGAGAVPPPGASAAGGGGRVAAAAAAAAAPAGGRTPTDVATARADLHGWDAVAASVLGYSPSIWQELFHAPFTQRAQQLISASFEAAGACLLAPLQAALDAAAASDLEPAGAVGCGEWPSVYTGPPGGGDGVLVRAPSLATPRAFSDARRASLTGAPSGQLPPDLHIQPTGHRQSVHNMCRLFDLHLREALAAALQLMAPPPTPSSGAAASAAAARSANAHLLLTARTLSSAGSLSLALPPAAAAGGAPPRRPPDRSAELQPFVQQQCAGVAGALADELQTRLARLGPPREGPLGAPHVEQLLLLGRLCSALVTDCGALPLILGPPDAWHAGLTGGGGGGAGTARAGGGAGPPPRRGGSGAAVAAAASATSPALAPLLARLRRVAGGAYAAWARWVAACLCAELDGVLRADPALRAAVTPLTWCEVVVAEGGSGGGGGGAGDEATALALGLDEPATAGDMRFALPAFPTSAVVALLMGAVGEVRRAGDHTAAPEALRALAWELHGGLLSLLQGLVAEAGAAASTATPPALAGGGGSGGGGGFALSEKGVLQLLMDARFVRDVLRGGRPADGGGGGGEGAEDAEATAAAVAAARRKREAADLEQSLQDLLDPIDWATYEPYLWEGARRCYRCTATLLGALAQLQDAYPTDGLAGRAQLAPATSALAGAPGDSNPLGVVPVVPRFQYLPITTPLGLQGAAAKQRHAASFGATVGAAGSAGGAVALLRAGSGAMGSGGGSGALGAIAAAAALGAVAGRGAAVAAGAAPADLASLYSFSDLGTRQLGGASAREDAAAAVAGDGAAAAGAAVAAGASAAFTSLQAKLQSSSLGVLSGMLGDRAAEVTAAMGQNIGLGSIGEYLPGGALGSGLLSSFTRR